MFLITDIFFPRDIELQRVRSDKNSLLWFSFRLLLKSRPYCSVEDYSPSQSPTKHHIFVRLELENSVFLNLVLLSFTPVASRYFSFPSSRSGYTATLSSTCFWIFLPSRIQSGQETDVGRQRLNHSSLLLSRFTEYNLTKIVVHKYCSHCFFLDFGSKCLQRKKTSPFSCSTPRRKKKTNSLCDKGSYYKQENWLKDDKASEEPIKTTAESSFSQLNRPRSRQASSLPRRRF